MGGDGTLHRNKRAQKWPFTTSLNMNVAFPCENLYKVFITVVSVVVPTGKARGMKFVLISLVSWVLLVAEAHTLAQSFYQPYSITTWAGWAGHLGSADGTNQTAQFFSPYGIALAPSGEVFIADQNNHVIRRVTPDGGVTTVAGLAGNSGSADGTNGAARFSLPKGICVDNSGTVFVADTSNHTIRRIDPVGTNWVVTTIAGTPQSSGSANGANNNASFYYPAGLAVDAAGIIYVADTSNHTIRKVSPVETNWSVTTLAGQARSQGSVDGTNEVARFRSPNAVAISPDGNLFVADTVNQTIRKVTPTGVVTTLAGTALAAGSADGTNDFARFFNPYGITADVAGNVFIADGGNHTIRKMAPVGTNWVVTLAAGQTGYNGTADGIGSTAQFQSDCGVAIDTLGNLYVADTGNHTIRKGMPGPAGFPLFTIQPQGGTWLPGSNVTITAKAEGDVPIGYQWQRNGVPLPGATDGSYTITNLQIATVGSFNLVATNGSGSITSATPQLNVLLYEPYTFSTLATGFDDPASLAVDQGGNVYVANFMSGTKPIRRITPDGTVTTISEASALGPNGLAVDKAGNLYVAYRWGPTICKLSPSSATNWVQTTLAGLRANPGSTDGTNSDARFGSLGGLALDNWTNLYVADTSNHTVRKVTPAGVVSTIAGLAGIPGSADGTNSDARFSSPDRVAVDAVGNIYVADFNNNTIRKITASGTNWVVTTLAGTAGSPGSTDGNGSQARFSSPEGVAADGLGNVYVADWLNSTIRKIAADGTVTTLAGWPGSRGSVNGMGLNVRFNHPLGIAVDVAGNLYVADSGNNAIRKGGPSTGGVQPTFTVQPRDQGVRAGGDISLSVGAVGTGLLKFQWWFGNAALAGKTNSILTIGPAARTNSGFYSVGVTNSIGGLVSSSALVRVLVPARLQKPQAGTAGAVRVVFQDSDGGVPYDPGAVELQWRTNLPSDPDTNWEPAQGSLSISNGIYTFEETNAVSKPSRFYRVVER